MSFSYFGAVVGPFLELKNEEGGQRGEKGKESTRGSAEVEQVDAPKSERPTK